MNIYNIILDIPINITFIILISYHLFKLLNGLYFRTTLTSGSQTCFIEDVEK